MDDSRYYTICNSHVLTGAKAIGYVGIVLSFVGALGSFITFNLANLLIGGISLLIYVCVVCAQRQHDPQLYLPFLIMNGIGMIFNAIYIGFLTAMLITMPIFWQNEIDIEQKYHGKSLLHATRVTTAVILCSMIIVEVLVAWFQSIVYRAYRYMKEDETNLIPPDVFVK